VGKPLVAIVGRPNVGKSTLFNRIIGARIAIVEDEPGVTRDRLYGHTEWNGVAFSLIDTGGIVLDDAEPLIAAVRMQAELAIDEAHVIVYVVDGQDGSTRADDAIVHMLHQVRKRVILVVNKIDHPSHAPLVADFYAYGLGEPYGVSSTHGLGIGDVLDVITALLPEQTEPPYEEDVVRIACIGRPNVGKSSIVNALLGTTRCIVSETAGTTRDAIDTPFAWEGAQYVLIDTAGMRKRGKVYEATEKYSVLRAMQAIERCDVALLVLDATVGLTEQDKHIAGYAHDAGRAAIIVYNKWDAIVKDEKTVHRVTQQLREQMAFLDYAPVTTVSAKTKQRMHTIMPIVREVAANHRMRIATAVLNDVVSDAVAINPPPPVKGRKVRVKYTTQVSISPPTMLVFTNEPQLVHFSYVRYLENRIRTAFPFIGTPLRIVLRKTDDERVGG
jgi:GTP-binding protein